MKKCLALVLTLLLTAGVLSGCSADPKTQLMNASKKTSELASFESNIKMTVNAAVQGVSLEIPVTMNVKYSNKDDKPQMSSDLSMEFMSMKVQMQMYYTDGYMYMDAMGQKTKEATPIEDAMKVFGGMSDMSGDMITEIKTEKVEGGTKYTPTIDEANMMDYVGSLLEKAKDTMGGAANAQDYMDDVNIKNLQTYIIVGNDGYISEQWMSMDLDADVEEAEATDMSMSIELTNTFVDPGKDVTVTLPDDLDTYAEDGSDI